MIRVFTWRTNYDEDYNNSKDDDNDDGDDDEKDNDDNDDDDAEVESVNIKGQTGRCCLLHGIGET